MRIGAVAENLLERVALLLGLGPRPLLETHTTLLLAQSVMAATRLGVFEVLEPAALTGPEVAARCGTDEVATRKLLDALAATGYLRVSHGSYALTADARTWLLKDSPQSLHDSVLFRFVEWEWIGGLERFVRTGRPLDIHAEMSSEQ